jgi:hypothetical protein
VLPDSLAGRLHRFAPIILPSPDDDQDNFSIQNQPAVCAAPENCFPILKVTHTRLPETGCLSTCAHARIFYGLRPALLDQSQF